MTEDELAASLAMNNLSQRSRSEMRTEAVRHVVRSDAPRPTGDGTMLFGQIAIATGVVCALVGLLAESGWYWFLLGGGVANLGLISLVTGYIVRAISFLPGKGDR